MLPLSLPTGADATTAWANTISVALRFSVNVNPRLDRMTEFDRLAAEQPMLSVQYDQPPQHTPFGQH